MPLEHLCGYLRCGQLGGNVVTKKGGKVQYFCSEVHAAAQLLTDAEIKGEHRAKLQPVALIARELADRWRVNKEEHLDATSA